VEQDLLGLLKTKYGDNPTGVSQRHLEFAMSNRERARRLIEGVEQRIGFQFAGARVLDVGCAYAGVVITAAQRGASAWGVELDPGFYRCGVLNAKDEPGDIHVLQGDMLSAEVLQHLPRDFSLAVCNCLFEHVADVGRLLQHLHVLLADGGIVLFKIPNGEALQSLLEEGHKFQPGLTLLPPEHWQETEGIYYRPWSYYLGLFHAFGFREVNLWNPHSKPLEEMTRELTAGYDDLAKRLRASDSPPEEVQAMLRALDNLRERVRTEARHATPDRFQRDYVTAYWEGYAVKNAPCSGGIHLRERAGGSPLGQPLSTRLPLTEPLGPYRTRWNLRSTVTLACGEEGLKCKVAGTTDVSAGQYGGVALRAAGLWAARLQLTFLNPEVIDSIFVYGYTAVGQTALRWEWDASVSGRPGPGPQTYVLLPGVSSGGFIAKQCTTPEEVASLHVFIRLAPGARAGFLLHRADIAPA